jgi:hypothetical protein
MHVKFAIRRPGHACVIPSVLQEHVGTVGTEQLLVRELDYWYVRRIEHARVHGSATKEQLIAPARSIFNCRYAGRSPSDVASDHLSRWEGAALLNSDQCSIRKASRASIFANQHKVKQIDGLISIVTARNWQQRVHTGDPEKRRHHKAWLMLSALVDGGWFRH